MFFKHIFCDFSSKWRNCLRVKSYCLGTVSFGYDLTTFHDFPVIYEWIHSIDTLTNTSDKMLSDSEIIQMKWKHRTMSYLKEILLLYFVHSSINWWVQYLGPKLNEMKTAESIPFELSIGEHCEILFLVSVGRGQ